MRGPRPIRLLLSCRDPNGAHQVVALAREARKSGSMEATIVADPPGLAIVRAEGLPAIEAGIGDIEPRDHVGRSAAMARARTLFADIAPDAVVASSSGPGGGIDEALIAVRGNEKTFVLQDSWGDVNQTFGRHADCYFVLDAEADSLTRRRTDARIVVTGMPKYDAYSELDTCSIRDRTRAAFDCNDADTLIAFMAQPLFQLPGYPALVRNVVAAVAEVGARTQLVLRAHPKDSTPNIGVALEFAMFLGMKCRVAHEGPIENPLAAADIVVSAYSSSCYDAVVLARNSPKPLGTVIYFLPDTVWRHYCASTGLDHVPPVAAKLALLARSPGELRAQLDAAREPSRRDEIWRRLQTKLPAVGGASRRILDSIAEAVGRTDAKILARSRR